MPHVKLFIPGPTEVRSEVLQRMAHPMISHRSSEAAELQKTISLQAAQIMFTEHPVLFSTSSGTGLMEGGIRNGVKERVLSLDSLTRNGGRVAEEAVGPARVQGQV